MDVIEVFKHPADSKGVGNADSRTITMGSFIFQR